MSGKKILLGVIVLLILYFVYIYVFKDSSSTNLYSGGNAKNAKKIKASKLPGNPASVSYTYSIWIYVNSWQYRYGQVKQIFYRSADTNTPPNPNTMLPQLSLAGSKNDLSITIGLQGGQMETWNINNIPLQKWCNIIVTTTTRAVDTYIDGKLVNTHTLPGVPITSEGAEISLTPNGGFDGETSKFRYYSRTINPREAYEIYREGPGSNWLSDLLNQYKIKLSFLKDNEEINSFSI